MANKHLRLAAHCFKGINRMWWHEIPKGIELYFAMPGNRLQVFVIRWQQIQNALKRKMKK